MSIFSTSQQARILAIRQDLVQHAQDMGKTIEQSAAEELHLLQGNTRIAVIHAAVIGSLVGTIGGFVACFVFIK